MEDIKQDLKDIKDYLRIIYEDLDITRINTIETNKRIEILGKLIVNKKKEERKCKEKRKFELTETE